TPSSLPPPTPAAAEEVAASPPAPAALWGQILIFEFENQDLTPVLEMLAVGCDANHGRRHQRRRWLIGSRRRRFFLKTARWPRARRTAAKSPPKSGLSRRHSRCLH